MAIPYQAAKFKSANIFAMAILDPAAKFNSCQYFRLYKACILKPSSQLLNIAQGLALHLVSLYLLLFAN